ncbi:helix-turn-helix domain-containing protein [Lyngbya sp. CCY1209]|uniref:helix-turn-helix domain-containing protein n=1 Tax=Lyngbya sp. CCY1209 TaxID=2886103 RepID=UPI002D2001C9|nr:helix-turn-helix domain-containing protein [Lyngbya sp. CCY1209]MEB3885516.1 helix-turn-helix domain-containing protein [Lyngbya sp. CCY1209]
MIKNERQYRITKAQVEKFSDALAQQSVHAQQDRSVHPLLRKAEREALEAQLAELRTQVEEYEALKAGRYAVLELNSLEELPPALIKARIAAGLTQKDLAQRLGLKEQQIQRYEETEYASASFTRLVEVSHALGVRIREDILLPQITLGNLLNRLSEAGIDRKLIVRRFLPSLRAIDSRSESNEYTDNSVIYTVAALKRVFGWSWADIFGSQPLQLSTAALGSARFKVGARTNERRLSAYTVYAHFLALLTLEITSDLPKRPIPTDPLEIRDAIFSTYGSLTFENALRYVWSLGIPVLPLKDSGAFHGAFWRMNGRNVIVLKQQTPFIARWLFDLLHELYHAAQEPESSERTIIEEDIMSEERRESDEEVDASEYAADVVLDNRAYQLFEMCLEKAENNEKYDVARLKGVVPKIAQQENVSTGALANYVAFCLSLMDDQKINWWGTANNLQVRDEKIWETARDIFLEYVDFGKLNEMDRNLLFRALSDNEE